MKNPAWDEMVFEKRNQSYGAYTLRKEYSGALGASVVFMLVLVGLLIATTPYAGKIFRKLTGSKATTKVIYIIEPPDDFKKPRTSPNTFKSK